MEFDVSKDENRLFAGVLENKSGSQIGRAHV